MTPEKQPHGSDKLSKLKILVTQFDSRTERNICLRKLQKSREQQDPLVLESLPFITNLSLNYYVIQHDLE
jgi:hypothetical protein